MASSAHGLVIRDLLALLSLLGDRFERRRIWSPAAVAIGLLLLKQAGRRQTYRTMLLTMTEHFSDALGWQRRPSAASFAQARTKLSDTECRAVLRTVIGHVDAAAGGRFEHPSGRRLVAIDSTRMVMPRTASTIRRFPRPGYAAGKRAHYPQALAVFAVDVTKRLPLDWVMLSTGHGERDGALRLAQDLRPGDIVVLDRGFPAQTFLRDLIDQRLDVVMRMVASEVNGWHEVVAFLATGLAEQEVDIRVGDNRTVRMRLVRRNFRPGRPRLHQQAQTMVILTTLLDEQVFPREEILRIYTARWGVETLLSTNPNLPELSEPELSRIGFTDVGVAA